MIILNTTTEEQIIRVIPRELLTSVRLVLIDKEQSSNNQDKIIATTISNEFMLVPIQESFFKEGSKYEIGLYNTVTGDRIFKYLAYCTDSIDLQNFKLS